MFMSAANPQPAPSVGPDPGDGGAPVGGTLLALVRTLIAYGRAALAPLAARNNPVPPPAVALRFGCLSLTVIIARITRGLMIAAALEQRLRRRTPSRDAPPSAGPARPTGAARGADQGSDPLRPARPPAGPRPARAKRPSIDPDAELPDRLPTAQEIAERLRHRPAGAVIVEICRDLGIGTSHPLWPEIQRAIIRFGGNPLHLLRVWHQRIETLATRHPDALMAMPAEPISALFARSTDPP